MPQQWQSLSVIRRSPPHYGTCRVATCRAPIEWVTTTGPKRAVIPVDLPLDTSQEYPRHDGQIVTVIDQRAVPLDDLHGIRGARQRRAGEAMNGPPGGVLCGCGRMMRVKKNSVTVEELMGDGEPYKLSDADLYACEACGIEIITGFGSAPFAEHWHADYAVLRDRLAPIYPARSRD